jgi:IclR family transcriptional regulator, KDG regulon repressor
MSADREGHGVRSVKTALNILETIAFSDEALGVTQIAQHVNLTKGSAHRQLKTLVDCGYLTQNPTTTRYHLGSKSRLLSRLSSKLDLVEAANGPMRELREFVGQTVSLAEMTQRGALVLETLVGSAPIEIVVRVGSELPFHSSAQGKILLAFAPRLIQERELKKELVALSAKTKTDRRELEIELEKIRTLGHATAPEEMLPGLNAIAAPIFVEEGSCVGSIAIIGSLQFLPAVPEKRALVALTETAREISKSLAYRHSDTRPINTADIKAYKRKRLKMA